ncbi:hypothetical protein K501DRAFT_277637 [Backusella circina FSU 941]|nr:hypothetical protein K501DRAFT_277637 [Backusella circina FSU 941]
MLLPGLKLKNCSANEEPVFPRGQLHVALSQMLSPTSIKVLPTNCSASMNGTSLSDNCTQYKYLMYRLDRLVDDFDRYKKPKKTCIKKPFFPSRTIPLIVFDDGMKKKDKVEVKRLQIRATGILRRKLILRSKKLQVAFVDISGSVIRTWKKYGNNCYDAIWLAQCYYPSLQTLQCSLEPKCK